MRRRSLARGLWDGIVVLVTTGAVAYVPLTLLPGFVEARAPGTWALEVVLTVVFGLDLVVRVRDARRSGGWAAWGAVGADALAAAPFFLLGPTPLLALRLLKLVRVAGTIRALGRRFVGSISTLRLASFAYGLLVAVHLVACGFLGLEGIDRATEADRYLDAAYWTVTTLTTVGYGDVLPQTPVQKLYAIGVMLLGVGLYAFLVGNIASLLSNIDPLRNAHIQRREQLDAFLRYRALPRDLRHRVQAYYDYRWERRRVLDEDAVLADLPHGLRDEVALHLRRDLIRNVPLFADASDALLRDVALQMRLFVALPGDEIVRAGEPGREMFFLSRGEVVAVDRNGNVLNRLTDGDFFGEIALVTDARRTATVRAVTASDLYVLDRELFERVLADYPEAAATLRAEGERRRQSDGTPGSLP